MRQLFYSHYSGLFVLGSVCTSVILGGNEDLTEDESRFEFKIPYFCMIFLSIICNELL